MKFRGARHHRPPPPKRGVTLFCRFFSLCFCDAREFTDGDDFDAAFENSLTDIDWLEINKSKDVVFDFAVNITKAPNAAGEEYTGLWTANDESCRGSSSWSKKFDHLRNKLLMEGGFLNVDRVPNNRYRHDMFALFRSIGGFRYNALPSELIITNEDGSGGGQAPLNFLSTMQAYHTIKSPFYTPRRGSYRMTRDIMMEDLPTDPDAGLKIMVGGNEFSH